MAKYLCVQNSKLGIYRLNELIMNHNFTMQRILVEISRKVELQTIMTFQTLEPKLVEKLVWVPVILFCKIFIPSY